MDVTATGVHLSPFRDPTQGPLGDEFDGQEIPFEAPESRDVQVFLESQRTPTTPVSSSSDAEVPEINSPASSTDFQDPRPAKKRHQRKVPPATKAPGSIGRQARDKTSEPPSLDRMQMGGALDAVFPQDAAFVQDDSGMHSDRDSSAYPAVKTPGPSPRADDFAGKSRIGMTQYGLDRCRMLLTHRNMTPELLPVPLEPCVHGLPRRSCEAHSALCGFLSTSSAL